MGNIDSPNQAGELVRNLRLKRGLTQQQLAERAGVSRKFVTEFEAGHERAELGKSLSLLRAVGAQLQTHETSSPMEDALEETLRAFRTEAGTGAPDFAIRLLAKAIAYVEQIGPRATVIAKPQNTDSGEWEKLYRAAMRYGFRRTGIEPPAWTHPSPLQDPWYPAAPSTDRYAEMTRRQTPPELAEANIFLREKSLSSV